ncbi:MAG: transcriptional regulator [Flavobacteriaceae bacterium]|nr:MAG: transcriptional regulator [Flavobacteriaceae bacterium]
MINNIEFSERLRKLLSYYDISAAGIAEILGIQRSTMSHLLSGRNKPSLDVVLKILKHYPEVELYWLINGQGDFPKKVMLTKEASLTPQIATQQKISFDKATVDSQELEIPEKKTATNKQIDRIVIFYTDGTFSHYNSNS